MIVRSEKPIKYRKIRSVRWALFSWFDIPSPHNPEMVYLRRLRVIQTPLFGVYLHWIFEPDSDRDAHDHPWRFWSLVVRGGYVEKLWDAGVGLNGREFCRAWWSLHSIQTNQAHTITEIWGRPLTLVFVGARVREWGFWTDKGWVAWRLYVVTRRARRRRAVDGLS